MEYFTLELFKRYLPNYSASPLASYRVRRGGEWGLRARIEEGEEGFQGFIRWNYKRKEGGLLLS